MRILHVIQRYYPAPGGAEVHLQALSERLARDGHAVTVATTDVAEPDGFWTRNYSRIDGACASHNAVEIRRFPIRQPIRPDVSYRFIRRALVECSRRGIGGVRFLQWLSQLGLAVPDLPRWLNSQRGTFDLVASVGIGFESLYAPLLDYCTSERIPFVTYPMTHLGEAPANRRESITLRDYYTMRHQLALLRASDAVIAQTSTEQEYLAANGVQPDRIVLAGSGVEPSNVTGGDAHRFRLLIGTADPLVLALGTQTADKGTLHLIAAMELLWQQGHLVRLVLAGRALPDVERFLARRPDIVRRRTHKLGPVSDQTKSDALAACALLVLPSRTDSFGIVLLEAWLNGKPVVGVRAGGLPDVITDGVDGLLVDWSDTRALAAAIEQLLRDPAQSETMGRHGKEKVLTRLTWDAIYPIIRGTYERLTG